VAYPNLSGGGKNNPVKRTVDERRSIINGTPVTGVGGGSEETMGLVPTTGSNVHQANPRKPGIHKKL